ncbi:hypothetical protein M405DRAFT_901938 [Rhizopogon salebrosus TDB-379]|nr:hypothetical protein M405DRAFT_901938 [Rhizopogon salebrosus TDB-379]
MQLTQCCKNGGCAFPMEMVAGIRVLSTPLKNAMNSERSRLLGSALDLVTVLSAGLGPAFDSLVALFMPTLLGLCARTNKVFAKRTKACIFTVIENIRLSFILPYLTESVHNKLISPFSSTRRHPDLPDLL